jgi:hypothetical protein
VAFGGRHALCGRDGAEGGGQQEGERAAAAGDASHT